MDRACRILIYDEEPVARAHIRALLEQAGEVVVEAGCVDEALLLLAGDHIKAVVSNTQAAGRDLMKTVRRRYPEKMVITVTERCSPSAAKLPDGVIELSSPFSDERLREVVSHI
jgi:DNA-binding NarL/FixJ family response regulator